MVKERGHSNGTEDDNSVPRSGAVYIFTRDGDGLWSQESYIKASNTGMDDQFGYSVALSEDTLAVGAYGEDSMINGDETNNSGFETGAAYVFVRDSAGVWSQQAYIKASNPGITDQFGKSVALSGDTLAVAAYFEESGATGINGDGEDNSAFQAGAVYVFTRDGTSVWRQSAYVKASNTDTQDLFGRSIALSGDTLVVGAIAEDSAVSGIDSNEVENSGAVYIFQ